MSAVAAPSQTYPQLACSPQPLHERRVVRLWDEAVREEQADRYFTLPTPYQFEGATSLAARRAWQQAKDIHDSIPKDKRMDLPDWRAFAMVFGFLRTGATLKNRPMLSVELSIKQIAKLIGLGRTTIKQVLRWLGCESITYKGEVLAGGLGYLHRVRRTAKGYVFGKFRDVYRTSQMLLTRAGRLLLGLPVLGNEWGKHSDDGDGEATLEELRQQRRRERRRRWAIKRTAARAAAEAQKQADEAQKRAGIEAMQRTVAEITREGRVHPMDLTVEKRKAARESVAAKASANASAARALAAEDVQRHREYRAGCAAIFAVLDASRGPPGKGKT